MCCKFFKSSIQLLPIKDRLGHFSTVFVGVKAMKTEKKIQIQIQQRLGKYRIPPTNFFNYYFEKVYLAQVIENEK